MKKFVSINPIILFLFIIFQSLCFANSQVSIHDNLVSIQANNVSLKEILNKLHNKTGIIFYVDDRVENEIISVTIRKQAVENVLNRLLKPYGKIIVYGNNGGIDRVEIFNKGERTLPADNKDIEKSSVFSNELDDIIISAPTNSSEPEMEIIESERNSPVLELPTSNKSENMETTAPSNSGMEIILPEKTSEVEQTTLTD